MNRSDKWKQNRKCTIALIGLWLVTFPTAGSSGTFPRSGIPLSEHIFSAPPDDAGRMTDSNLQVGQTNPDMFSITPRIGRLTFRQKSNSFRTSKSETSWGVVTITAPSMPVENLKQKHYISYKILINTIRQISYFLRVKKTFFLRLSYLLFIILRTKHSNRKKTESCVSPASAKYWTIDKCSSLVPGGVSTKRNSKCSSEIQKQKYFIAFLLEYASKIGLNEIFVNYVKKIFSKLTRMTKM